MTDGARDTPVPQIERPIGPAEALHAIQSASGVVLTTHVNADGDAAGSQAALATYLHWRFRTVAIVNPTPFPDRYRFLLPDLPVVLPADHEVTRRYCKECTLAVILDTGEVPRIGRVAKLIGHLPKLVIDHHPQGTRPFQGLVFRDESAPATGSMILEMVEQVRLRGSSRKVWPPVARALYAALLSDTGGFRFSNVTSRCLRDAARLVELGADPEELHGAVFGRFPRRRFDLLREALATLEFHTDERVAWMTVPDEPFKRLGATVDDLEGFVDVPRGLEGVEVAMLFRTTADGKTKVSLRSTGEVNVNEIATELGGGGHTRASGVVLGPDREEARAQVLALVEDALASVDAKAAARTAAEAAAKAAAKAAEAEDARQRAAMEAKYAADEDDDEWNDDDLEDFGPSSDPSPAKVLPWPTHPESGESPVQPHEPRLHPEE